MTAPVLRPYQVDVISEYHTLIGAGTRRLLMVSPTGAGKTVIFTAIGSETVKNGGRVLVLAHRHELVDQASGKLSAQGIDAGIIMPEFPHRPGQAVQVASIQTLHGRGIRGRSIDMPPADLVIVDEAHHILAPTYQNIVAAYPDAIILGVTATPCRGDNRGLGDDFEVLFETPDTTELIRQGFLVPALIYAPVDPDLKGVEVRLGDYAPGQLQQRMNTPELVGDIVENWFKYAERRRTIAYASGVEHSVFIRDEFRRAGIMAEHIDGKTPADEREQILRGLASGDVEIVTNYGVLTEGFDCPDVGCLILARPTKSFGLYRQMIGRGLRAADGKKNCIVIDHSGAVYRHGPPDEPVAWSLSPDKKMQSATTKARGERRAPALVNCPECSAIRFEGKPCPACGWRPRSRGKYVEFAEGELGLVNLSLRADAPEWTPAAKLQFYAELLGLCVERGWKPGAAWHKFREKFGVSPPWRNVTPISPSPAVRSWVRSRQIAYAKAREKMRRAG